MNSQSAIRDPHSAILIAGAGPAGSSLAIRLAQAGFDVTLVERERFPRQKLCGEFISPECLRHFLDLGVASGMLAAGGDRIFETRFFEIGGKSTVVPSSWFGSAEFALSLSRAEMDHQLLQRARAVGVTVIDGASVTGLELDSGNISSLKIRDDNGEARTLAADIYVDATGRSRILSKFVKKSYDSRNGQTTKPFLVGFKTHLRDVDLPKGYCELYSFPHGYAGLSNVEGGLANICFLIEAVSVRTLGSDASLILERAIRKNRRAAVTLADASPANDWLAVSIDSFGTRAPVSARNLFSIGDAASFIDPFTGSGMVMAFESAEIFAGVVMRSSLDVDAIRREYDSAYRSKFTARLRLSSVLRRTAFMPRVATAAVSLLGISRNARRLIARSTRG
jgi:flavin-dependent dehydrogenase